MNVTVTQRGGFVGSEVMLAQVDTGRLDANTKKELEQEIAAAMAATPRERPAGADLLEYKIVVEDQGRRDEMTWVDDGSPSTAPARDLVARIQQVQ